MKCTVAAACLVLVLGLANRPPCSGKDSSQEPTNLGRWASLKTGQTVLILEFVDTHNFMVVISENLPEKDEKDHLILGLGEDPEKIRRSIGNIIEIDPDYVRLEVKGEGSDLFQPERPAKEVLIPFHSIVSITRIKKTDKKPE